VIAYRFLADRGGSTVVAAWSTRSRQDVALPVTSPRARSVTLMDEVTDLDVSQGSVRVSVDRDCPLLVVVDIDNQDEKKNKNENEIENKN
jgi:hypothetical protein